jgi:pSer/pThr/pTyr-binding forkhead associated (FHA) protein
VDPRLGRLIIRKSGEKVQERSLVHGHLLIGRSHLCDILIDSPTVSRQHALISYSSDGAMVSDLSSTNGTFVDGYQVKYHKLEAGESVAVGNCRIDYVIDDDRQASYQEADNAEGMHLLP